MTVTPKQLFDAMTNFRIDPARPMDDTQLCPMGDSVRLVLLRSSSSSHLSHVLTSRFGSASCPQLKEALKLSADQGIAFFVSTLLSRCIFSRPRNLNDVPESTIFVPSGRVCGSLPSPSTRPLQVSGRIRSVRKRNRNLPGLLG